MTKVVGSPAVQEYRERQQERYHQTLVDLLAGWEIAKWTISEDGPSAFAAVRLVVEGVRRP